MDLGFLNDISLTKTEARTRSASIDTTPASGAHLRLFSDGRIFPATQIVEDHSLEYVAREEEVGNGYDIIDTDHFPNYPKGNPRLVMIALVSKDAPKVDLFGSVGYDKSNGEAKSSVLTQGSSTTGKWLITLLEEVYGEDLFSEGTRFIDLVINMDFGITTPNNIYQFPKFTNRGPNKGEVKYQRRTDTELWPLTVLVADIEGEVLEDTDHVESEAEENTKIEEVADTTDNSETL